MGCREKRVGRMTSTTKSEHNAEREREREMQRFWVFQRNRARGSEHQVDKQAAHPEKGYKHKNSALVVSRVARKAQHWSAHLPSSENII